MQLLNINQQYNLGFTHPNLGYTERSTTIDYCLCCERVTRYMIYASLAPYDLNTLCEHRGIIIDIDTDISELQGQREIKQGIPFRKLTTSNPTAMKKYLEIVEENFERQNIFKRATKLLKRIKAGHTDKKNIKIKYEQIDSDVHGICTNAEKYCRRTIAGSYVGNKDENKRKQGCFRQYTKKLGAT